MCNHYQLADSAEALEMASLWDDDLLIDPDIAGSITEEIPEHTWPWKNHAALPVVYAFQESSKLGFMRWGILNRADPKRGWISNARDDKLLVSRTWKPLAATRRCLVVADGFYEPFGEVGSKREALFHLPDRRPFFFAGVWEKSPADGAATFAIVTGKPNTAVAALPHDRMPVILGESEAHAWLGNAPLADADLLALCRPYEGELVRADQPLVRRESKGKISKNDLTRDQSGELPLD